MQVRRTDIHNDRHRSRNCSECGSGGGTRYGFCLTKSVICCRVRFGERLDEGEYLLVTGVKHGDNPYERKGERTIERSKI
jgi:hypothetical protein